MVIRWYGNIFIFSVFMMKRDQDQQDAIHKFWDAYRSCVEEIILTWRMSLYDNGGKI
jgi:hypothetical protein